MLDRFSKASLAILNRAGLWAAAEEAEAIETAHIRRALERATPPSGRAVSLWTPDAKQTLSRALALSYRRKSETVEVSDLRKAIATSPPIQAQDKGGSSSQRATPETLAIASPGAAKDPATQGRNFRRLRLGPVGTSLSIVGLIAALTAIGMSLLSGSPKPPPPPRAASGGFDFQLKENEAHHVTLDVFVLFAQKPRSLVVLVPHVQLKPGQTVPWRVIATGAMKAARLNGKQPITVVHQPDATIFYGVAHHQSSMNATFLGEPPGRPEQTAFFGPALVLEVPGPFIRFGNGYAVVGLPALGEQALSISGIVGGSGAGTVGFGNPELAMNLTMTHGLPKYQMTAISPSPVSDDPFEWKATGYMRVSAVGVDPEHGDDTERSNVYAGLLLGFALSLLLPLVNSIRRGR